MEIRSGGNKQEIRHTAQKDTGKDIKKTENKESVNQAFDKKFQEGKELVKNLGEVPHNIKNTIDSIKKNPYEKLFDEWENRKDLLNKGGINEKEKSDGGKVKERVNKETDVTDGDYSLQKVKEKTDKEGNIETKTSSLLDRDKDGNFTDKTITEDNKGNKTTTTTKAYRNRPAEVEIHDKKNTDPPVKDRERLYKESQDILKALDGSDSAKKTIENKDGSKTEINYKMEKSEDGKIIYREEKKTVMKDGKIETSSSIITRNSDGNFDKTYNKTDKNGNHIWTSLKTKDDGTSSRESRTVNKNNSIILSAEQTDNNGNKNITSDHYKREGGELIKTSHIDEIVEYKDGQYGGNKEENKGILSNLWNSLFDENNNIVPAQYDSSYRNDRPVV